MNLPSTPPTLAGARLVLEPLDKRHADSLRRAAGGPDFFRYMGAAPDGDTRESFENYIEHLRERWGVWTWAMLLKDEGDAIGLSAFLDIRPHDRGLEIGSTWIGPRWQGTWVNPEAKYLQLRYAFEDLVALRVQLKCDERNLQSQRAIVRLGATREGVLRRHMILPDGYIRNTVMFSITDEEWPAARRQLEDRLGYVPVS